MSNPGLPAAGTIILCMRSVLEKGSLLVVGLCFSAVDCCNIGGGNGCGKWVGQWMRSMFFLHNLKEVRYKLERIRALLLLS